MNDFNFVVCPICNKEMRQLNNAHVKTHGLNMKQFRVTYPDVPLVCGEVRQLNITHSKQGFKLSSARDVAKQKSEKMRTEYNEDPKICKHCNAIIPYEKRTNDYCSSSCSASETSKGKTHTDETKQKISAKMKISGISPAQAYINKHGTKYIPKSRLKRIDSTCPQCGILFQKTETSKQKYCSTKCRIVNSGGYRSNSTRAHRTFYKDQQMDSQSELKFAQLLDKYGISWSKNTSTFFTFTYPSGKPGKYYPDFFLPEYNSWVEIKGTYYLRSDDDLRWASCPNHEVIWYNKIKLPAVCTGIEPV